MTDAAEQITLKITGASGGSNDPVTKDTFALAQVEWRLGGATNLHTLNFNKTDNCYSKVTVGDVFVVMKQSKGSPNLMGIFSKRKAWDSATIIVKTTGEETMTYSLTTVVAKSYRSVANGSDLPVEEVWLHFADMKAEYKSSAGTSSFQISGRTQDGKPA